MNTKLVIASGIALVAASTSFAEPLEAQDFSNLVSTKSRAEVITELKAARANETLQVLDTQYPPIAQNPGAQRSRQEVVAELEQFRTQHPYFNSEVNYPDAFHGIPPQQRLAGMKTPPSPR